MGRSLTPIAKLAALQPYDAKHHNPFDFLGSHFEVRREGPRVWHRQTRADAAGTPLFQEDLEVHYAVGSGARGFSYLTDRGGALFQTPISWFSQKQIWDASPGFAAIKDLARPIEGACLFCHANRARFREGSINLYDQPIFDGHAIGCERCHGPGKQHALLRATGESVALPDYTIVNPRHLEAGLRETVCQQCHLDGEVRVIRRGEALRLSARIALGGFLVHIRQSANPRARRRQGGQPRRATSPEPVLSRQFREARVHFLP